MARVGTAEVIQLAELIMTRRKDRLRVLYAVFLAQEIGEPPVLSAKVQKRIGLDDERFEAACAHLVALDFMVSSHTGEGQLVLTHRGEVTAELAIMRLDRDVDEFPALRSILSSDLSLPRTPED